MKEIKEFLFERTIPNWGFIILLILALILSFIGGESRIQFEAKAEIRDCQSK